MAPKITCLIVMIVKILETEREFHTDEKWFLKLNQFRILIKTVQILYYYTNIYNTN
jgi:hypothetical protein